MYEVNNNNPAYAVHAHESRSNRYSFISTSDVIHTFQKNNFEVSSITTPNLRKQSKVGYQHHMVRMRPTNYITTHNSSEIPEVIIINSHDGTKAFRLGLGFFRFVCSNGLITGDFLADSGRVMHKGNIADTVIEYISDFSRKTTEKIRHITEMKTKYLSDSEIQEFTSKARDIINPNMIYEDQLLRVNRSDDNQDNLWTIFNVIQENAMKGRFDIVNSSNVTRKARPIKNLTRNIQINSELWTLAEEFIE